MTDMPQVDAVVTVPSEDAVKTFPLDLDSLCMIGEALVKVTENLERNEAILAIAKAGAEKVGDGEEWESMNASLQKTKDQLMKTVTQFVAIHDAMHDGENVQVVVVPF